MPSASESRPSSSAVRAVGSGWLSAKCGQFQKWARRTSARALGTQFALCRAIRFNSLGKAQSPLNIPNTLPHLQGRYHHAPTAPKDLVMDNSPSRRNLLLAVFVLSGFAGLIYQSIWSHYLGLFLGHAAYAQTLVLALFMGGMAVGAAWIAKAGTRWRNLIRGYAVIELLIGVLGLAFHALFVGAVDAT